MWQRHEHMKQGILAGAEFVDKQNLCKLVYNPSCHPKHRLCDQLSSPYLPLCLLPPLPPQCRFLLAGPTQSSTSTPNPAPEWLTEKSWVEVVNLSMLRTFQVWQLLW
jgi:hypothetical protein